MVTYGRYICSNPECLSSWHYAPGCPYRQPVLSAPITASEMRTIRHLRHLERIGVLEPVHPISFRWVWAVPPLLVVLLLLMLL